MTPTKVTRNKKTLGVLSCPKLDGGVLWRCSTTPDTHPLLFLYKEGGDTLHKS